MVNEKTIHVNVRNEQLVLHLEVTNYTVAT